MQSHENGVSHSVSLLIEKFKASDRAVFQEAAVKLWQRYAMDLLVIARRRLERAGIRHRESEDDVLQSVYRVLASGDTPEKYKGLNNREDLWKLLVTITHRRVSNKIKRHRAASRNAALEWKPAPGGGGDDASLIDHAPARSPSPDDDVISLMEVGRLLAMLDDPLRQIALWKLDGYTNEEIAGPSMMDCAVRTVERKLQRIRGIWENMDDAE
jgi:DNA-directed RNA polymerase specialized sigma24 family protein